MFLLFTLLFEFLLLILGTLSYIQGIISNSFAGMTSGKIISIKERKHNTYISTYSLIVCYKINGEKFFNRHMKIVGDTCNYKINQILQLKYHENKPSRSRIIEDNGYVSKKKLLILFIIMCITAVFIPITYNSEQATMKKVVSLFIVVLGIITYTSANFIALLKRKKNHHSI